MSKQCEQPPLGIEIKGGAIEEKGREEHKDRSEQIIQPQQKIRRIVLFDICGKLGELAHTETDKNGSLA